MPVYRLVRTGVKLTLDDYIRIPAKMRVYLMLWNEIEAERPRI